MLIDQETRVAFNKTECKNEIKELQLKLAVLQRECRQKGIPIAVLIAGPSASGKGKILSSMLRELDPRGFRLLTVASPPTDDFRYPYLWRFWNNHPPNGMIGIFVDNWYHALFRRIKGFKSNEDRDDWCHRINILERQLTDSGCRIIKFYLHVSKQEQKKRLEKLDANKNTSWQVTAADWKMSKNYENYLEAAEEVLKQTNKDYAPWTILPVDDEQYASLVMLKILVEVLEKTSADGVPSVNGEAARVEIKSSSIIPRLEDSDLSLSLDRDSYEKELDRLQKRLEKLHNKVYRKKAPVVIAYEGWDAAGKGGNIKRLARSLDPRGYEVLPISAPTDEEKSHHYLWRFWKRIPRTGHIAIFDRTWYGRVLVEKVEGFCTPEEYERAFIEIPEMEYEWTRSGVILLKFWIHIGKEEQLRRFKEREKTPYKQWKITDEDWRNREKWDKYVEAVNVMFQRTHSDWAPWTIIESNSKLYARIKVLKTVVETLEAQL